MSTNCGTDQSCPFLYYCQTSKNLCVHKPIFPLSAYPLVIYILFPFCSAICNLSGNSFGQYKPLLLMDLLNYSQSKATVLAYPLISGTALINLLTLIPKRHPKKDTSLVDYNIIMVLIPNILFGSTIGALVNYFVPPIAADAIIIPMLCGFAIKFFYRYLGFKKQQKQKQQSKQVQMITINKQNIKNRQSNQSQFIKFQRFSIHSQLNKQLNLNNGKQSNRQLSKPNINQLDKQLNQQQIKTNYQNSIQLKKLLIYESGMHIPHILATILIFLVFETLSFLAQGKIIPFTICTKYYVIGVSCLAVVYILFILIMYQYTRRRMEFYQKVGYQYDGRLQIKKRYALVCFGGFFGGFNGGLFGVGSSTTMLFVLLFLEIEPAVVSATVGFQVVFAGLASLSQAFARNQINGEDAGFFFGITFILGGACTLVAKHWVKRFNLNKVNQILMLIVFSLLCSSIIGLLINIIIGFVIFGIPYMTSISFNC